MVHALTQRHRAQQLLLRKDTKTKGARLFSLLDWERLDDTFPAFAVPASQLVQANRRTSAGLSAAYVRALRQANGINGAFTPTIVTALDVDQFTATVHSTSVAALKSSSGRGVDRVEALRNASSVTQGALARLVLSAGRDTVLASVATDSRATGWERVLGGTGCPFCQELAGRVYATENAGFEAHGNCACSAEPVFE